MQLVSKEVRLEEIRLAYTERKTMRYKVSAELDIDTTAFTVEQSSSKGGDQENAIALKYLEFSRAEILERLSFQTSS